MEVQGRRSFASQNTPQLDAWMHDLFNPHLNSCVSRTQYLGASGQDRHWICITTIHESQQYNSWIHESQQYQNCQGRHIKTRRFDGGRNIHCNDAYNNGQWGQDKCQRTFVPRTPEVQCWCGSGRLAVWERCNNWFRPGGGCQHHCFDETRTSTMRLLNIELGGKGGIAPHVWTYSTLMCLRECCNDSSASGPFSKA